MKKIPLEIADELEISRDMIYRINNRSRKPSPELAKKIILAMRNRGEDFSLEDIRPDLAELLQ